MGNNSKIFKIISATLVCAVSSSWVVSQSINTQIDKIRSDNGQIKIKVFRPYQNLFREKEGQSNDIIALVSHAISRSKAETIAQKTPNKRKKVRKKIAKKFKKARKSTKRKTRLAKALPTKKIIKKILKKQIKKNYPDYQLADNTLVSGDLELHEFLELQEFLMADKYSWRNLAGNQIAQLKEELQPVTIKKVEAMGEIPDLVAKMSSQSKIVLNAAAPARPKKRGLALKNSAVKVATSLPKEIKKQASPYTFSKTQKGKLGQNFDYLNSANGTKVAARSENLAILKSTSARNSLKKQIEAVNLRVITPEAVMTIPQKQFSADKAPQRTPRGPPAEQAQKTTPKSFKIQGLLENVSPRMRRYGHFEIGFYKQVNSRGEPLGSPSPNRFLPNVQDKFSLEVASDARGYLFACFIPKRDYPNIKEKCFGYSKSALDVAQLVGKGFDRFNIWVDLNSGSGNGASVANLPKGEGVELMGRLGAMFAKDGRFIAIKGADIGVRGSAFKTRTDAKGRFRLRMPKSYGEFLIEITKPGYFPSIRKISVAKNAKHTDFLDVKLASREAITKLASSFGVHQVNSKSVFIGRAKKSDAGFAGMSVQLTLNAKGPYYFDVNGYPAERLRSTTTDGRVIYFNVEPGVGFVEASVAGNSIAPFVVSAAEGGDLIYSELEPMNYKITGRLLDSSSSNGKGSQAIAGARVRIAGSSKGWTQTDPFGAFEISHPSFIRGEEILLEVSRTGIYNHRYSYQVPKNYGKGHKKLDLYAFSVSYINSLADSVEVRMDSHNGLLMGHLGKNQRLRIDALTEHSEVNQAKDFYYDEKNLIQGSHAFTHKEFGTYSIFDISPGRVILQGHDQGGQLRYSRVSYFSPSTVNIVLENN